MSLGEPDLTSPLRLTREQRETLVAFVKSEGRKRRASQGDDFRAEDYIAGAMTIFFAFHSQDMIPAGWVFSFWAGGDPLDTKVEAELRREVERARSQKAEEAEHLDRLARLLDGAETWSEELLYAAADLLRQAGRKIDSRGERGDEDA